MENEKKNTFDRKLFLQKVISEFMNKNSYKSLKTAFEGYIKLLDRDSSPANQKQNIEKKRILHNTFAMFNNPMIKKQIEDVRAETKPQPQVFIRAISKALEERILGDVKRKYNMSKLTSNFTGSAQKDISYKPITQEPRDFENSKGETISIQLLGRLEYLSAKIAAPDYVNKYRVSIPGFNEDMTTYDVFTVIDMNMATDPKHSDYTSAVVDTLLNRNNIELSNANGYIGEITPGSYLDVNAEKFDLGFYTYQISEKQALVFEGEKIGAIKAFTQEHDKQNSTKKDTER